MRIFCTKWFARYARQENIAAENLLEAVERAERGLIDADLGGGLIKQRIPRKGQGRSGGYRTILAYRVRDFALFLYGFAKNETENIGANSLQFARELAAYWLTTDAERIAEGLISSELVEVFAHDKKNQT
jgi:hypothetical protein